MERIPDAIAGLMVGAGALWGAAVLVVVVARRYSTRQDSILAGVVMATFRIYAHLMHHVRFEGEERVPMGMPRMSSEGVPTGKGVPLIVVANHTAGIDPVLIQAGLPFEVRWMMAEDMRMRVLQPLWDLGRMIFVDRDKPDSRGLREALRHLALGGVLGVFPEGAIERPARHILTFREGIGFLIKKSGAAVLPVVIEGTPYTPTAWGSIWRRSTVTIRFLPMMGFANMGKDAAAITRELEELFANATGWPKATPPVSADVSDTLVSP